MTGFRGRSPQTSSLESAHGSTARSRFCITAVGDQLGSGSATIQGFTTARFLTWVQTVKWRLATSVRLWAPYFPATLKLSLETTPSSPMRWLLRIDKSPCHRSTDLG